MHIRTCALFKMEQQDCRWMGLLAQEMLIIVPPVEPSSAEAGEMMREAFDGLTDTLLKDTIQQGSRSYYQDVFLIVKWPMLDLGWCFDRLQLLTPQSGYSIWIFLACCMISRRKCTYIFNAHPADTPPFPVGEAVLEEGRLRKKISNSSQLDNSLI